MIDIILAKQKATLQNSLAELRGALSEDDNWRALSALESVGEAAGGVLGYAWIARREELVEALSGNPVYAVYCELERTLNRVLAEIDARRPIAPGHASGTLPPIVMPEHRTEPRRERIAERIASLAMPHAAVDSPIEKAGAPAVSPAKEAPVPETNDHLQIVTVQPVVDIAAAVQSILTAVVMPQLSQHVAEPAVESDAQAAVADSEGTSQPVPEADHETAAESEHKGETVLVEVQDARFSEIELVAAVLETAASADRNVPEPVAPEEVQPEPLELEEPEQDATEIEAEPSQHSVSEEVVISDLESEELDSEELKPEELKSEDLAPETPADDVMELPANLAVEADGIEPLEDVFESENPAVDEDFNSEGNIGGDWDEESEAEVSIVPRAAPAALVTAGIAQEAELKAASAAPEDIDGFEDYEADSVPETETLEQRLQRLDRQSESLIRPNRIAVQETAATLDTPPPQSWLEIMRARRASAALSTRKPFENVPPEPASNIETSGSPDPIDLNGNSEHAALEAEVKIVRRKPATPSANTSQTNRIDGAQSASMRGERNATGRPSRSAKAQQDDDLELPIAFSSQLEEASVEIVRKPSSAKVHVETDPVSGAEAGGKAPGVPGPNRFFRSLTGE